MRTESEVRYGEKRDEKLCNGVKLPRTSARVTVAGMTSRFYLSLMGQYELEFRPVSVRL